MSHPTRKEAQLSVAELFIKELLQQESGSRQMGSRPHSWKVRSGSLLTAPWLEPPATWKPVMGSPAFPSQLLTSPQPRRNRDRASETVLGEKARAHQVVPSPALRLCGLIGSGVCLLTEASILVRRAL